MPLELEVWLSSQVGTACKERYHAVWRSKLSYSTRNEQEQMHCHHSEIRINKLLAKCCNSFVMDLMQTFPFIFFSYESRETFPFICCFWWFISSGFESRCFDNSEKLWNGWSWLLPDKRSCLLVCSTNMYEFSEEKQREMWMHWCFPLAFSPMFFENNIFQCQNCELWRGQKDWGSINYESKRIKK